MPTSSTSTDSRPREFTAVVFDLDGTLVDSSPDLATAVNRLRSEIGLAAVSSATVVSWIGEGARRLVEKALADAPDLDPSAALPRFLELYEAVCTEATVPYAGVEELLSGLHGRLPIALLTNKPERMTRRIVEHLGWTARFEPLIAGDTLPFRKPDPRGLFEIAERLALPVRELLLVGDSAIDAATARGSGAGFVFAAWGFALASERAALSSERRIRAPEELRRMLEAP